MKLNVALHGRIYRAHVITKARMRVDKNFNCRWYKYYEERVNDKRYITLPFRLLIHNRVFARFDTRSSCSLLNSHQLSSLFDRAFIIYLACSSRSKKKNRSIKPYQSIMTFLLNVFIIHEEFLPFTVFMFYRQGPNICHTGTIYNSVLLLLYYKE